jgi:hypothetical protein
MRKESNINISPIQFPSQLATDAEKASVEFGLRVGQAIQYEWFRRDSGSARYYNQWKDFNRLRLYARGEQPIQKYKNELAIDGDLSYLNIDWTPVPIIPKFVDIVVNGMSDRLFTIKAYAQDALSADRRNQYQDMIEGEMAAKEVLLQVQDKFGIDPFMVSPEDLPNDDEELSLFMQLNYKPAIEIAEEEAINTILLENHYDDIKRRFDYDLTTIGIAVGKHEFLPGEGVKINYVDPANVIYSYTEDPYFRDCFYWGEVKTVPMSELIKINPRLTKEELEEIAKTNQSWGEYYSVSRFYSDDVFSRDTCTLLYFNYKTTKTYVYKKKILDGNASRVIEKDEKFNPPAEMMEEGRFERIEKTIDVWYEGVMVAGTQIVLKWQLMENMVRPKSASQMAMPNYVAVAPRMYKGTIESLTRRMIPFADLIQITHLKLQQVISRMVPDGVFIDADGLNEVDLGNGNAYNPEDALRLYFQTGSVVGRSYTGDGDFNNARVPVQPLTGTTGQSKMAALINNYNHYLEMLRGVTGLNEARDGSDPDPRALVGVQKLAALNSNTATRHILDASLFMTKTFAEALSVRVSDILEYADFAEEFAMQIGKYNVGILRDIKDLYLHDFGIFIELSPDEEQKERLEQNIQIALSRNDINLEDAIDIREIKNIKMANQLLKVKRTKKMEQDQKNDMMKQQMQAQINMQSQQAAAQMEVQKIQLETESKIQLKQAENAMDLEKLKGEAMLKLQLMEREFQYNMQLNGMQTQLLKDREEMKEDRKDDRVSKQNTQQSKLISQRKNNLPPMKFESNEDSLDKFDLASFEPK